MGFIYEVKGKGKGHPATGRGGPRGSGWVKAPDFLDVRHDKGDRSSAISRSNPWYSRSEAKSTSGHMALSGGSPENNPQ